MRRFVMILGMVAALAGATAAPAAAQTITPPSYDWGQVNPKQGTQPTAEFQVTAGLATLIGDPAVISGDSAVFNVLASSCDGSLNAGQSCIFRVRLVTTGPPTGAKSAVVGIPSGPTATVKASFPGSSGKGKKCKKGKKGAASAKKKGCKKKGKKR